MSNQNYITNILNLKENNLMFKENFYCEEKIKGITHKIFEAYLSYKPTHCYKCGVIFDNNFEKHGFITSNIKIPDISGFKSILKLHKQRYLCKHCNKAFTLSTNIVNYGCFISNNTKHKIATDLPKKRSETDIAFDNNVSPNTVERIMDSYYETQKLYKYYLPTVLCFDEFKSVKSADGAMSFHMCDGTTGKIIDIVEDRRLDNLIKYFFYYDYKARSKVKFIIIDMYSPYVSLIKKMFPNAEDATVTILDYQKNLPKVISFDEFKADTRAGKYAFILNDPIHRKVLDILPSRKKERLIQYFTHTENRRLVEYIISDMYESYLLVQQFMFPHAKYVVDRFHYTRYILQALDKIRIRLQNEYGIKSREYKLLKNKKNVSLLRKYSNDISWWVEQERYVNGHMVRILPGEIITDILSIDDDLKRGYQLKEFIDLCYKSEIEEMIEAASTIDNWLPYIVNSFIDERLSNGFIEGLNNKIKVVKRVGFGYKNFNFFRIRLLYILNSKNSKKSKSSKNKNSKK